MPATKPSLDTEWSHDVRLPLARQDNPCSPAEVAQRCLLQQLLLVLQGQLQGHSNAKAIGIATSPALAHDRAEQMLID